MDSFEHLEVKAKDGTIIPAIAYHINDSSKKAVVIISHGFGEHSGSYREHAERLWQGGYASVILDQRGHGKPPEGQDKWHGTIPHYQCFIDDIVSITDAVKARAPGVPIALYGHSMGGNIVLNVLLRLPPEQAKTYFCAVVESPWLDLYDPLNPVMHVLIKLMNIISPNYRTYRKLNHDDISSDKEKNRGYDNDPYYHGFISARMIDGIIGACSYALNNAEKLSVKTYLAYAKHDIIVSNEAILEFISKAGNMLTVKEYDSHHAIYNDVNRVPYCHDVIAYLDSNLC
ncbi:MAG: lysophospholipase [Oscillospiraceae bacterium]|nr:lysophospholipase [Oscillospiraceae bacterium]